jgi:hypothetical protein
MKLSNISECGVWELLFCISQNPFYICPHKSNIPSFQGCLVFIKKGGEIRLCETLATKSPTGGERCQNLIPEKPGDDKNKTRKQ